jgi:hypothetical protein
MSEVIPFKPPPPAPATASEATHSALDLLLELRDKGDHVLGDVVEMDVASAAESILRAVGPEVRARLARSAMDAVCANLDRLPPCVAEQVEDDLAEAVRIIMRAAGPKLRETIAHAVAEANLAHGQPLQIRVELLPEPEQHKPSVTVAAARGRAPLLSDLVDMPPPQSVMLSYPQLMFSAAKSEATARKALALGGTVVLFTTSHDTAAAERWLRQIDVEAAP